SAEATYARVKALDAQKGLVWLTPSRFSNTYALALPRKVAEAYPQVATISQLNQVLRDEKARKHLVALDTEFANRPDGLEGLKAMYDLQVGRANIRQMDAG